MRERKRAGGSHRDRDRAFAFIATAVLQAVIGFAVLQLRPDGSLPAAPTDAIQVEFIKPANVARLEADRPEPPASLSDLASGQRKPRRAATLDAMPEERNNTNGSTEMARGVEPDARLDLRVPEPPPLTSDGHRDVLARRPVLDPRRTRFEHAWAPAGNVLDQARFRSKSAAFVLGLFGGPPRKCTEVERRLRKANCLPADADELDDDVLLRGAGP